MELIGTTYLSEILHIIAQALLVPVVVMLLLFIGYSLFCIGSIIAETFTTRKEFKLEMPEFLSALGRSKAEDVADVITRSGLLNRQIIALLTLWDYRTLSEDSFIALAKRLLSNEELRYARISGRTDAASKLAPMLGLMGTLIPLGPGIVALGERQLDVLSASLLIAFDTTVAGLIAAFVCFIVSKIRKNWYKNYMMALESSMTSIIDKVNVLRAQDALGITEPTHLAKDYAAAIGKANVKNELHVRKIAQETAAGEEAPFSFASLHKTASKTAVLNEEQPTAPLSSTGGEAANIDETRH